MAEYAAMGYCSLRSSFCQGEGELATRQIIADRGHNHRLCGEFCDNIVVGCMKVKY